MPRDLSDFSFCLRRWSCTLSDTSKVDPSNVLFDYSHLHEGERNRIKAGQYDSRETLALLRGENPWPKPGDSVQPKDWATRAQTPINTILKPSIPDPTSAERMTLLGQPPPIDPTRGPDQGPARADLTDPRAPESKPRLRKPRRKGKQGTPAANPQAPPLPSHVREKFWKLGESNLFMGGGIGIALAAYAFLMTGAPRFAVFLLIVAWLIISVSIFRHRFFERRTEPAQRVANGITCIAIGGLLAIGWFLLSPSSEPASTAATEKVEPKASPNATSPLPLSTPVLTTSLPAPPSGSLPPRSAQKSRRAPRTPKTNEEQKRILRDLNSNNPDHSHSIKPQTHRDVISKAGLQKALSTKLTKKGMRFLIKQVQQRGVAFKLTPEYEQELRSVAAKHGNKSLDSLIAAVREADSRRETEELLERADAVLNPHPPPDKPDWRKSDAAKQLAAQMISDVQQLIDEGRLIDLTNYQEAVKAYVKWTEKCSVTLGRIDNQMRKFDKETTYRSDFEGSLIGGHRISTNDDEGRSRLRSDMSFPLLRLKTTEKLIPLDVSTTWNRRRDP